MKIKSLKMKLMKLIISFCVLGLSVITDAQEKTFKNLKIGDKIPSIEIKNAVNHSSSVKFSGFKEKLVILDFWATWCTPCIASFFKLDSLQEKFGDKINILPVTLEDKKKVMEFFQKMKSVKGLEPSSVTDDTLLNKLFRHSILPHYVWIKDESVIAITGGDEVTEANIQKVIQGSEIKFAVKNDYPKQQIHLTTKDIPAFIPSITLKSGDETKLEKLPIESLRFYSSITGYLETLPAGYQSYHNDIFTATNLSILTLYKIALFENRLETINMYPGGVIVDIADSTLYDRIDSKHLKIKGPQYRDWIRRNGYCYDMKVPDELKGQKFKIMLEDLDRYFGALYGIEGAFEKRNAKYLALIRTSNEDKLASKGGATKVEVDNFSIDVQNARISNLIFKLYQPLQLYPKIINETGYEGKIDMKITCVTSNLNSLNKELQKYGLMFQEKEKIFDVPVIRLKKQ